MNIIEGRGKRLTLFTTLLSRRNLKRPLTYNKVRFAMHWKLSPWDLLEHRLYLWHSFLLLDLGGQASRQQWHAKGSLQNRFRAYAFRIPRDERRQRT